MLRFILDFCLSHTSRSSPSAEFVISSLTSVWNLNTSRRSHCCFQSSGTSLAWVVVVASSLMSYLPLTLFHLFPTGCAWWLLETFQGFFQRRLLRWAKALRDVVSLPLHWPPWIQIYCVSGSLYLSFPLLPMLFLQIIHMTSHSSGSSFQCCLIREAFPFCSSLVLLPIVSLPLHLSHPLFPFLALLITPDVLWNTLIYSAFFTGLFTSWGQRLCLLPPVPSGSGIQ